MADFNWIPDGPVESSGFQTDWFAVQAASHATADGAEALQKICRTYWYPLYAYVRRKGHGPEDAQDLTQSFFAHLLERPWLRDVHPAKGRFRSFLLASLNNFLTNEWRRNQTLKRGGSHATFSFDAAGAEECLRLEPSHNQSPDKLFDRHWALAVLYQAQTRLQQECVASGKGALFEELKGMLDGEKNSGTHVEIAARLGMTEPAVKKAAQRLRERYQELLRAEIAPTVSDPREVDEELRQLFAVLLA